jgi:two-component system OmpR family response regulator
VTLDATYRRTDVGDEALRSVDTAIPVDYRRILCVIEGDTHSNVIRGRLRRYRDSLIDAWLAELEELGFIETARASAAYDLDFEPVAEQAASAGDLIEFPDELQQIAAEAKAAGEALHGKGAYLATARLQNREPLAKEASQITVLLVEDDPDQAALADLRISMAGYRVRLARSRRETIIDLKTQAAPDVVLLDVMLPDGNGFDILAKMRQHERYSLLPVILLTALASTEDIRRGLDLGADGYMTKPYSKDLLVDTIRQVLRLA